MTRRLRARPGLQVAWLLFLACGVALAVAPGVLVESVPGLWGLPWGNLVAAVGLVAAGAAGWMSASIGSPLRVIASVALANAVVWLPVSIAIAGNVRLTFPGRPERLHVWFGYTLLTGIAVLVLAFVGRFRRG
jgi:hypothetical protein